ncbi:unnamed protein product, partial [marine sediment metagenome]
SDRTTIFGEFIDELDRETLILFANYMVKMNKKMEQEAIGHSSMRMEAFFDSVRPTAHA